MSLIVRDPFETLTPLRDAMNRLFEEIFVGPRSQLLTSQAFPVDIYEIDDHHAYVVEATLPGAKPEQIQITAVEMTVTICVAEKQEGKVNKGNYVRRERYEGEMQRTIVTPPVRSTLLSFISHLHTSFAIREKNRTCEIVCLNE